jgi:pimeloyl-ACP methyl ester carboxylesterase
MPSLTLGDERIFYARHGSSPAGAPGVLLHGAGENHLVWPGGLRRLPGSTTYALDLPGHGKSNGIGRRTIDDYAAWLADWSAALRLPRLILIGHSMGGAIAQLFALTYPAQTAALVLMATSARLRVSPQLLELAPTDWEAACAWVTEQEWGPLVTDSIKQLGRKQLLALDPAIALKDYQACHHFDVRDRVSTISVPTLVIAGEADRMTPLKHVAFLAEQIPGAQLITIPQTGHMVMLEAERLVTDAVSRFLRGLQVAAGA